MRGVKEFRDSLFWAYRIFVEDKFIFMNLLSSNVYFIDYGIKLRTTRHNGRKKGIKRKFPH